MKKIVILVSSIFLLLGIFIGTSFAVPMYNDYYKHPKDSNLWQQDVDRIGTNPPFEIYGHSWNYDSSLQLIIWTDWSKGLDGSHMGSSLGDVFILVPDLIDIEFFTQCRR